MDCCGSQKVPYATACQGCGARGQEVKVRTLKHWLVTSLVPVVPDIPFYFCGTRDCSVVYFSADHSVQYAKEKLRYPVGAKETTGPVTICYCFGVTEGMISKEVRVTGESPFSTWIAEELKLKNCACDVRNPTGRCCLKEVKRVEAMYTGFDRAERR